MIDLWSKTIFKTLCLACIDPKPICIDKLHKFRYTRRLGMRIYQTK